jgi:hypothetical protein
MRCLFDPVAYNTCIVMPHWLDAAISLPASGLAYQLQIEILLLTYKFYKMPDKSTIDKALEDKREGKSASTQAGEFVHDEIEKIRKGEHGARSAKQAIAIGLSEARRAGVKLAPPKKGTVSEKTRMNAERESEKGLRHEPISRTRSRARVKALKREPASTVSKSALSRQTKSAAKKRSPASRSASARKAAKTRRAE